MSRLTPSVRPTLPSIRTRGGGRAAKVYRILSRLSKTLRSISYRRGNTCSRSTGAIAFFAFSTRGTFLITGMFGDFFNLTSVLLFANNDCSTGNLEHPLMKQTFLLFRSFDRFGGRSILLKRNEGVARFEKSLIGTEIGVRTGCATIFMYFASSFICLISLPSVRLRIFVSLGLGRSSKRRTSDRNTQVCPWPPISRKYGFSHGFCELIRWCTHGQATGWAL